MSHFSQSSSSSRMKSPGQMEGSPVTQHHDLDEGSSAAGGGQKPDVRSRGVMEAGKGD